MKIGIPNGPRFPLYINVINRNVWENYVSKYEPVARGWQIIIIRHIFIIIFNII